MFEQKIQEYFSFLQDGDKSGGKEEGLCACGRVDSCTLGVKRDGRYLLYNCFRPTCNAGKGRVLAKKSINSKPVKQETTDITIQLPSGYIPKLPKDVEQWLLDKSCGVITPDVARTYKFGYDAETKRIVMPVYNGGTLATYCARDYTGNHPVKILTPKGAKKDALFFSGPPAEVNVIVEDVLSAIRLEQYGIPSVAILGTTPPLERLWKVYEWSKGNKVVVMLDDDAKDKALKLYKTLLKIGCIAKICLTQKGKDPKLLTNEELDYLFKTIEVDAG